MYLFSLVS